MSNQCEHERLCADIAVQASTPRSLSFQLRSLCGFCTHVNSPHFNCWSNPCSSTFSQHLSHPCIEEEENMDSSVLPVRTRDVASPSSSPAPDASGQPMINDELMTDALASGSRKVDQTKEVKVLAIISLLGMKLNLVCQVIPSPYYIWGPCLHSSPCPSAAEPAKSPPECGHWRCWHCRGLPDWKAAVLHITTWSGPHRAEGDR